MNVFARFSEDSLASVYVAEYGAGRCVEFVESVQPPIPRERKWVFIISSLFGCPVGCPMCDAGGMYTGKCTAEQMLAQCDYLARTRFPDRLVNTARLKVQFARMGEPSFNMDVLKVLAALPGRYGTCEVMPSISTVAPAGQEAFFDSLLAIKRDFFNSGLFQMQFSIHSTDEECRNRLIPVRKWSLGRIAEFGESFYERGDRKIVLNFAIIDKVPVDSDVLRAYFDPARFIIKMTPLNPTYAAKNHGLLSQAEPGLASAGWTELVHSLHQSGFDVIESIGEYEENRIGSNCGQYVTRYIMSRSGLEGGYCCEKEEILHPSAMS